MQSDESVEPRPAQAWITVALLFGITTLVEAIGVGQVYAFLPLYIEQLGLPHDQVKHWTGILFALVFIFGLPLVPFWGAWADKYSRKLIIIRSALVESVVFALVAMSQNQWQLAGSLLLVGFQLGNTGVMFSAIRAVSPRQRVGLAISLLGATSAVGFALGPAVGGWLVDATTLGYRGLFGIDAVLSVGIAAMLSVGLRDVKPEHPATESALALARRAIVDVVRTPATLKLFGSFVLLLLGTMMARPYLPLWVQAVHPSESGLAAAVGLVVGTAALVGALFTPLAGALGDRIGFSRMQGISAVGTALCLIAVPWMPSVFTLAVVAALFSGFSSAYQTFFYALIATVVPETQRSATLNLAMLPIYLGGIIGPAIGAVVVAGGLAWVAAVGAIFVFGALLVERRLDTRSAGYAAEQP